MSGKRILSALLALLMSLTLVGCAGGNSVSAPQATDYSQAAHWLSLPAPVKAVDIFYLYPTAWKKTDQSEPNICEIDNPSMLTHAPLVFAQQATAFETIGNIYAPYYRQTDAAYLLKLPLAEQDKAIGGIPKLDTFAAFDYYIKHFNNGRPFILAGHSQGSNLLIYLLSEYMKENPQVYDRMIAAYVIGCSVTDAYLAKNPHLKFTEGPDDTGVIISYNTEAPTVLAPGNPVVLPGALAINPITWTREETLAAAEENLGSILPNADGSIAVDEEGQMVPAMNYADARVDKTKGVVICSTVDVEKLSPGNQVFGKGVYHSFDYSFYYYNIRENAQNRVNKYLAGRGTNTTTATGFPVVVFSDVHFNPFYDPSLVPALISAEADEWAGIFKTSSTTAPSTWGTDTDYPSLELALSSIKQNLGSGQ